MKKVRFLFRTIAWSTMIMLLTIACSNDLDIQQVYAFELVTMPVQKKIVQNETAEIRCRIVREGEYSEERLYIRMFQVEGKGQLRMDDGTVFLPNDIYPLDRMTFRLYYTSHCTDQQVIDVFVENSVGQVIQKTFSFQNDKGEEDLSTETEQV